MIEIAPSQIYTIRDVAEYFKCSTRKVHRLVATGELKGFKIGNQRRFKGDEILRFIEGQGDGASEPMVGPGVQADRLYSLREVAIILQIPSNEVASLLRGGKLAGFRVGMEWRCWGRDLLRLAADSRGSYAITANVHQPPLLGAQDDGDSDDEADELEPGDDMSEPEALDDAAISAG
jgi:excisionase family DNA binding protein